MRWGSHDPAVKVSLIKLNAKAFFLTLCSLDSEFHLSVPSCFKRFMGHGSSLATSLLCINIQLTGVTRKSKSAGRSGHASALIQFVGISRRGGVGAGCGETRYV